MTTDAAVQEIEITVDPEALENEESHRLLIAARIGVAASRIAQIELLRRALDARRGRPRFHLRYRVWLDEPPNAATPWTLELKDVSSAPPVVIVGSGPAGLFAALRLIELGLRPIVLERGKDVRRRRRDVAAVSKRGIVDPDSNYCFGEGGAGTFSDGKLYTRSTKRGSTERILRILAHYGAAADILVEAHPHVGTNKLPAVISAISAAINSCGGAVQFGERLITLEIRSGELRAVGTAAGNRYEARAAILATGHSARDVFELLSAHSLRLEPKPFALGVRVEHRQEHINRLFYGTRAADPHLPAASYALRAQAEGRGVFSFCMCPGGIICPAASAPGEVVVNGWSPSKRNSRFANSGIVVEVPLAALEGIAAAAPWKGIELQRQVEQRAFALGGGTLAAPAERLTEFLSGRHGGKPLPQCSYNPGLVPAPLVEVFPAGIVARLKAAFKDFERSRPGYVTEEAVVVATESRTSSPIRVPRDPASLMHPDLKGLFPAGEGAGYAGGIVSAAMDGERAAEAVARYLSGE